MNKKSLNKQKIKGRYYILKSIGYYIIDKKTDEKIMFSADETKWKNALTEMAKYIREQKIKFKEIYFTSSLSNYDKKSLIERIK